VVLTASSIFGTVFEAIRQPTLNGYLLAGSMIGPDGLALVKELVQVESLAQVLHYTQSKLKILFPSSLCA
jgi:Kef-type K+ transport system membrane component KefB